MRALAYLSQLPLILVLTSITSLPSYGQSSDVEWSYQWTSSTTLEDATPPFTPFVFAGGSISQDPPNSLILASSIAGGAGAEYTGAAWSPASAAGTTVEFSMRVTDLAEGADYAASFAILGTSTGRRFQLNISPSSIRFFNSDSFLLDATVDNIYRLTFSGSTASLYVNNGFDPVLTIDGGGEDFGLSLIQFGDASGSQVGGSSAWNYIAWTNGGEFAPAIPEPSTVAFLGLGAIALLVKASRAMRACRAPTDDD